MSRRFVSLCLLALAVGLVAGPAGAQQQPVTLRIVLPEGFSARQMVDRVAEVRRIAIRKRGMTPELSGASYKEEFCRKAREYGYSC